jgi:hypothetical protein
MGFSPLAAAGTRATCRAQAEGEREAACSAGVAWHVREATPVRQQCQQHDTQWSAWLPPPVGAGYLTNGCPAAAAAAAAAACDLAALKTPSHTIHRNAQDIHCASPLAFASIVAIQLYPLLPALSPPPHRHHPMTHDTCAPYWVAASCTREATTQPPYHIMPSIHLACQAHAAAVLGKEQTRGATPWQTSPWHAALLPSPAAWQPQ